MTLLNQIICLSHTPWSTCPTRTQQLITRLPDTEILFFEPAGSASSKGRKVRPNVMVYPLPAPLPLASKMKFILRHGLRRTARYMEKIMTHHRFRLPMLWCTCPEYAGVAALLPHRGLVYDCDRYWNETPLEWEGALAAGAEVCFVASDGLADRLSTCSGNIVLLPNGNNFPMFSRKELEVPAELADLDGRPVLGFVGTLHADLDVSPLLMAADEHPEWTFLLIGAVEDSAYLPKLKKRGNIRILGQRAPVEIPDYLGCCDVCFHLLRRFEDGSDVIPCRIYEYLSAGKRIVSMLWPHQIQQFPDVVRPARTPEIFVEQCAAALRENPENSLRRRQDYGAASAWDMRARQVVHILEVNGLR